MQISILSVGTRGDVQPYIALGRGLQAAGHQVQLATLGMFEPVFSSYGLGFTLIEESPLSFIDRVIASGGNFLQRMRETRRIITSMMERLLDDAWRAVQDADLIITSNLLIYPGYSLSEKLGVPSIGTFLVPYLRTRVFPNPAFFSGQRSLGGRGNLLTYDLFNQATWQLYRSSMNKQRQRFGLSPLPMLGIAGQMLRENYPFLCACSPLIVPRPADWGDGIHVTGYWLLDAPASWQPPDTLPAFLRNGFWRMVRKNPHLLKRFVGTVTLTAIGMFGEGAGWGIPFRNANHTLMITLGGIGEKPGVVDGHIVIREYLSMTLSMDHDMIDGAPAARFTTRLKELIESGFGLIDEGGEEAKALRAAT